MHRILLLLIFALTSCATEHEHHSFDNAERWAAHFDDPARDAWQKPDAVVERLALSPDMRVADLRRDDRARSVAASALGLIPDLFGTPASLGCEMAVRATAGLEDPAEIAASLTALATELVEAVESLRRG